MMIRSEWTNNDALSAEQATQSKQMVEPRYIKATDVISILSLFYNYTDAERYDLALAISAVPTANVVEVKHGRWKGEGLGDYRCSLCGAITTHTRTNFCPNCGADMREEIV